MDIIKKCIHTKNYEYVELIKEFSNKYFNRFTTKKLQ